MNIVKFSCLVLIIFCITGIPMTRNLLSLLKCAEYVATVDELYTDERTGGSKIKVSCDVYTTRIIAEFSNEDNYEIGDTVYVLVDEDASVIYLAATNALSRLLLVPAIVATGCLLCIGFIAILFVCSIEDKRVQSTNYKTYKGEKRYG